MSSAFLAMAVQSASIKALTRGGTSRTSTAVLALNSASSTSLVCVIRGTVAVSASYSFAERGAAQRSCNMSSSQCGSKSQPVLLHCERSTPADGEKNLPAASDATPGQKRVHYPAKIPKRTEPARSALAVLNCSTPARALSSSSFSTCTDRLGTPVSSTLHEVATSSKHSMGWFVTQMLHELFWFAGLPVTWTRLGHYRVKSFLQTADGLKRVMPMVSVGHSTSQS